MIPVRYSLRSLRARPLQSATAALGVGLVVFVLACTLMMRAGLEATLAGTGRDDWAIVLREGAEAELTSQLEADLARQAVQRGAVVQAFEDVVVTMSRPRRDGGLANVLLRGVQARAFGGRPEARLAEGRWPRPGADEAVVGRAIAGRLEGTGLGEVIALSPAARLRVVGLLEAGGGAAESEVWAPVEAVARPVGREGLVSSVRVQLEDAGAFTAFEAALQADPPLGLRAFRERDYDARQAGEMSRFVLAIGLFVSLCFGIGGAVGAAITLHAQVSGRAKEIATLRALGFRRRAVLGALLVEAVLLCAGGAAVGAAAALAMARVRFELVNIANWSEVVFALRPTPGVLGAAVGVAVVLGLLGGLVPAIRAARIPPSRAMRGQT